jgi:signal transduction histidine kinase/CheY-like chemotaxis protein
MLLPWWPVIWLDVIGSTMALGLGVYCLLLSWRFAKKRPDDAFRHYVFLLTIAIVAFTISRSVGHLAKQALLFAGMAPAWEQLAPFSGAINSITFVTVFAFSIYFDRLRQIKLRADEVAVHLATVRTKAAAAEEAEIRLRAIFDGFSDAICLVDRDHRLLFYNARMEELVPSIETGGPCYAALHRRQEPCAECRLAAVLHGKSFNSENELSAGMRVSIMETPLDWPDGQRVKMTVLRDITETKSLEAQLQHAQKMEAVGVLAGGIAHDFNNLLTVIAGYAEILLHQMPSARREEMNGIKKAAQQAGALTRQLLLFSRKESLKPKVVDLRVLVGDLEKMLARLIGEQIELIVERAPAPLAVKVDPGQIEQVVMNLVINARDALPAGGRITIKAREIAIDEHYCQTLLHARPGMFVQLTVSDSGEGMSKEVMARIFEPFFTTKGQHKGTGLGLSVVYGIIKQHGGWINVYSEPKQGTTFRLYLPAAEGVAGAGEQEPAPLPAGRGEWILLVEDEQNVRQVTSAMLAATGYQVVEASGLVEALAAFDQEGGRFDLVVSDIVLSDGSGIQVFEQLRARNPRQSILLASGYADEKSQWPVIMDQKIPFLQKPFNMTELSQAVAAAIGGQEQGDAGS